MSFDPVDVGRLLPWSAKLVYIGALFSVVLAAASIVSRIRGRLTLGPRGVRRSAVAHLLLLAMWTLCGILTVITYVRDRDLVIPHSRAMASQAQSIREYLERGYWYDGIAGSIAIVGTLASWFAIGSGRDRRGRSSRSA